MADEEEEQLATALALSLQVSAAGDAAPSAASSGAAPPAGEPEEEPAEQGAAERRRTRLVPVWQIESLPEATLVITESGRIIGALVAEVQPHFEFEPSVTPLARGSTLTRAQQVAARGRAAGSSGASSSGQGAYWPPPPVAPPPAAPPPPPAAGPEPDALGAASLPPVGALPASVTQRVRTAGEHAAQKLRGQATRVPRTPAAEPGYEQRAHFVLVRGVAGERGYRPGDYATFRGYVEVAGRLQPKVIFHGLSTVDEAVCYWTVCFGQVGWVVLPPRP